MLLLLLLLLLLSMAGQELGFFNVAAKNLFMHLLVEKVFR
jgi:hypothetical protein